MHKPVWLTNAHIALKSQGNLRPHSHSRQQEIGRRWKCQNQSADPWRNLWALRCCQEREAFCATVSLFTGVFVRLKADSRRDAGKHISCTFPSLKLQVGVVDCDHRWFPRENSVTFFSWHSTAPHRGEWLLRPTDAVQAAPVRGDPCNNQGGEWIMKQSTECLVSRKQPESCLHCCNTG